MLCRVLDGYFTKKTNHRYLANIGAESSPPTEVKVWCDDMHIYITEQTFNEILKLQDCHKKISIKIKRTLAKNDLIKFYMVGERNGPNTAFIFKTKNNRICKNCLTLLTKRFFRLVHHHGIEPWTP